MSEKKDDEGWGGGDESQKDGDRLSERGAKVSFCRWTRTTPKVLVSIRVV